MLRYRILFLLAAALSGRLVVRRPSYQLCDMTQSQEDVWVPLYLISPVSHAQNPLRVLGHHVVCHSSAQRTNAQQPTLTERWML